MWQYNKRQIQRLGLLLRPNAILSEEEKEHREKLEQSFYEFVKSAWVACIGMDFVDNWHIEALCKHLEALYELSIKRLIVNLPPRMGKSTIISILYPAWCWIKDPKLRFLYNSYGIAISERDSLACRVFMKSDWFQRYWGKLFFIKNARREKFDNNRGGYRIASTISGANMGQGGDFIIIEDPDNIAEIESIITRNRTHRWFDVVMPSRVHNPKRARFLISQQRCHAQDLTGHTLSKGQSNWVHFKLPMEFERMNRCRTVILPGESKIWVDPRKKEGELLFPDVWGPDEVDTMKQDMLNDSYVIAGQLQQRPAPIGGGIIKSNWFKIWKEQELPEFEYIIQSWDLAFTKATYSSYSACTTWGVYKENDITHLMLISLFKGKLEDPDVRKMILRMATNYEDTDFDNPLKGYNPVNKVLIEDKAQGYSIYQDFSRADWPSGISLEKFNPNNARVGNRKATDKIGRCRLITHLIEAGQVWLPADPMNLQYLTEEASAFLSACETFPNDHDGLDIIDTMSQAFIWLTAGGTIYNKNDWRPLPKEAWKQDRPYW